MQTTSGMSFCFLCRCIQLSRSPKPLLVLATLRVPLTVTFCVLSIAEIQQWISLLDTSRPTEYLSILSPFKCVKNHLGKTDSSARPSLMVLYRIIRPMRISLSTIPADRKETKAGLPTAQHRYPTCLHMYKVTALALFLYFKYINIQLYELMHYNEML